MKTAAAAWRSVSVEPGAQVDLVIDRSDGAINLCEMKYAAGEYVLDKASDLSLRNKQAAFVAETHTKKLS